MSYVADCNYNSKGIGRVSKSGFGSKKKLLGAGSGKSKIAVTAIAARESLPCLFMNYNGLL